MNLDSAVDIADQLFLESAGAGDLFMALGEPDLELCALPDGELHVELSGLDVYDPTTGEISSHMTDEIACGYIENGYDEECFAGRERNRGRIQKPGLGSRGSPRRLPGPCGVVRGPA